MRLTRRTTRRKIAFLGKKVNIEQEYCVVVFMSFYNCSSLRSLISSTIFLLLHFFAIFLCYSKKKKRKPKIRNDICCIYSPSSPLPKKKLLVNGNECLSQLIYVKDYRRKEAVNASLGIFILEIEFIF